jgi:alpha-beta hydrolase superfamily lysophospholipase
VCYTLTGDEKQPLVVLCHGLEGGQWIWEKFAEWWRGKGYRTLTFDLWGHGESDLVGHARYGSLAALFVPVRLVLPFVVPLLPVQRSRTPTSTALPSTSS